MAASRIQHVEVAQIAASNAVANISTPTSGNLLLAWMSGDSVFTPRPTGFTQIYAALNNNDFWVGYKVATGAETNVTFTYNGSGSGGLVGGVMEYSGLDTTTVPEGGLIGIGATHAYNAGYAASGAQITPSVQVTYGATDLLVGIAVLGALIAAPSAPVWTTGTPLNGNNFASPGTGGITGNDQYAFLADNTAAPAGNPTIDCTWTGNTAATRTLMLIAFTLGGPSSVTGRRAIVAPSRAAIQASYY